MKASDVSWFTDMSLRVIEQRSELMKKMYDIPMHPLTIEEMYVLRDSLQTSDAYVRILESDLKKIEVNDKKRKFFRFKRK